MRAEDHAARRPLDYVGPGHDGHACRFRAGIASNSPANECSRHEHGCGAAVTLENWRSVPAKLCVPAVASAVGGPSTANTLYSFVELTYQKDEVLSFKVRLRSGLVRVRPETVVSVGQ
jgi:hypothetical protein